MKPMAGRYCRPPENPSECDGRAEVRDRAADQRRDHELLAELGEGADCVDQVALGLGERLRA